MGFYLTTYFRYLLMSGFALAVLMACAYQRPAGHWLAIDATTIYFPAVELAKDAIDPNHEAVCKEAQDEIHTQLVRELPAKISPLRLLTDKTSHVTNPASTSLQLRIKRCEIDVDQSGGSFTYYLTLPVEVRLTQNGKTLFTYSMNIYEQINIDNPSPAFEFSFAEPVSRTLLLFNGRQLWLPDN